MANEMAWGEPQIEQAWQGAGSRIVHVYHHNIPSPSEQIDRALAHRRRRSRETRLEDLLRAARAEARMGLIDGPNQRLEGIIETLAAGIEDDDEQQP